MKKLPIWVLFLLMAALCPAPIKETPPAGYVAPPLQQSQSELEAEQRNQSVHAVVGTVESKTEHVDTPMSGSTADATQTLQSASQKQAASVLAVAKRDVGKESPSPFTFGMWGIVIIMCGLGLVFGVRQWANRNIPDPTSKSSKITW